MLTDYADALQIISDQIFSWGNEQVALSEAAGRVLAEPLRADRNLPPFDRVTMDGIAINYEAYAAGQRVFPIAGIVAAGAVTTKLPQPDQCLEVMTGAVRPPGSTTIIRYEDLTRVGESYQLPDGIVDAANIHWQGSDAALGKELYPAGSVIGGAAIQLLASCGYAKVSVKKLPRVAIIATGDELVPVDQTPLPHQIRMSNLYQLANQLSTAKIQATTHHLRDDVAVLEKAIANLLKNNDILIFSGGVSKGKYDFLPEVLTKLAVKQLFHRVAQRPGKPIWLGRTADTIVFGLPGNPVSSLTGLLAYFGPFLRRSLGLPARNFKRVLSKEVTFDKDLTLFQIAKIDPETQQAFPVSNTGSGDAASLLRADGFIVLPRKRSTFQAGESFPFLPFDQLL